MARGVSLFCEGTAQAGLFSISFLPTRNMTVPSDLAPLVSHDTANVTEQEPSFLFCFIILE